MLAGDALRRTRARKCDLHWRTIHVLFDVQRHRLQFPFQRFRL